MNSQYVARIGKFRKVILKKKLLNQRYINSFEDDVIKFY